MKTVRHGFKVWLARKTCIKPRIVGSTKKPTVWVQVHCLAEVAVAADHCAVECESIGELVHHHACSLSLSDVHEGVVLTVQVVPDQEREELVFGWKKTRHLCQERTSRTIPPHQLNGQCTRLRHH